MPSSSDVESLRAIQRSVADAADRDLRAFVASLNLDQPEAARDALLEYLPILIDQYGDVAATAAADWYDEVRATEDVVGAFSAGLADNVPTKQVTGTARRIAGYLFTEQAALLLPALADKTSKYVLKPARQTIAEASYADPAASGWRRVTRSGSCGFCRMLAGRGGVYKKATADFASHGACNCAAVPSWDRNAPEVDVIQYVASQRTSRLSESQREAARARVRKYLADNPS